MEKLKNILTCGNNEKNRLATKGGSYSLMMTAMVLAIVIMVNLFVSLLPSNFTQFDISSSKLYSITSNTKVVVNALQEDVTIYWLVQSGAEDQVIENLLDKYESLSDHIKVVKKNPDVYPTFAEQYTNEYVQNNSLIIECGEKYRYIGLEDIYIGEMNLYSGTYSADSFDGEGAITSAIDYVTSDTYPQIYLLEGHGEQTLPVNVVEQIEKENIQMESLSLLTVDAIPANADCIMIYAPQSDISVQEKEILTDYIADGGKLWVSAGPVQDGILENLYSLLDDYGVSAYEGIVVDGDRAQYALGNPLFLLPTIASSPVTDVLIEENYYAIMPVALGLRHNGNHSKGQVIELLTTSYMSYSKIDGYNITTYDYEEGDIDGPFSVAVSIEDNSGGQIYWFTSNHFLEEEYNAFSSGSNMDLAINTLSDLIGESESMAIRTKSLEYNYLTISDYTASLLKILMIGVFPLIYLGVGIGVVLKRKKVQYETE